MAEILQKYLKQAYSIPEVCALTGLGRSSIYEAIASGNLVAVKWGRRTIVRTEDIEKFIRSLPVAKFSHTKEVA